jgi:NAD(P)-dependent dehydrogenase (short-subunit alcohol dehydrogenase family)
MAKKSSKKPQRPAQHQPTQPGRQDAMKPRPHTAKPTKGADKLKDKVAIITGGDSGIGRAAAEAMAREGADIAVVYLEEHSDARTTQRLVEQHGRRCLLIPGDVGDRGFCDDAAARTVDELGRLDSLVNVAGEQHLADRLEDITDEQIDRTFRTNIFSMFYLCRAALEHLSGGSTIINTTSVTAYRGSGHLVDYAATKGAITAFTRSLALMLAQRGIRVNAVAPGPIWTPLIPASFPAQRVETFRSQVPMGRAGEPAEVAPCYVFLASDDSSYMTGQVLHPNGGEIING